MTKMKCYALLIFLSECNYAVLGQNNDLKKLDCIEDVYHSIIYHCPGRFVGWPANCGGFIFHNDEIVTGFIEAPYKLSEGHNIDEPYTNWLARSLDGGKTWSVFDPEKYVGDFGDQPELLNIDNSISFKNPGFAMRIVGTSYHGSNDFRGHFFYSYDAGQNWNGPFSLGDFLNHPELKKYGLDELTPRTDYVIINNNECILCLSARKKDVFASDRLFCVKTVDSGKTFNFLGWVVKPFSINNQGDTCKVELFNDEGKNPYASECRAVMSQTVKLNDGTLISVMRRKFEIKGGSDKNWIDAYSSFDGGKTWKFSSKVADTGPGNGNPPALAVTNDGRLCVVYGERKYGTIQVVYSSDKGKAWSQPQILMDGFWSEDMEFNDMGYPRLVCRSDGKMVVMYYYSTKEYLHHLRSTIWEP